MKSISGRHGGDRFSHRTVRNGFCVAHVFGSCGFGLWRMGADICRSQIAVVRSAALARPLECGLEVLVETDPVHLARCHHGGHYLVVGSLFRLAAVGELADDRAGPYRLLGRVVVVPET